MLKNATLPEGETLLDVATEEGLIAFVAPKLGTLDRCESMRVSADDLGVLEGSFVYAVTICSVLTCVEDKWRAFEELRCGLRPGGGRSIFGVSNDFRHFEPSGCFLGYACRWSRTSRKRSGSYEGIQPPEVGQMLGFDEGDLLDLAESAVFGEIYLRYEADDARGNRLRVLYGWNNIRRRAGTPRFRRSARSSRRC